MQTVYNFIFNKPANSAYIVIDQNCSESQPLIGHSWTEILDKIGERYCTENNDRYPFVCCFGLRDQPGDSEFRHFPNLSSLLEALKTITPPDIQSWNEYCKITTNMRSLPGAPFYQILIKKINLY